MAKEFTVKTLNLPTVFGRLTRCSLTTSEGLVKCSAIAEKPRCRCVIVLAKSGRLELGDTILQTL